MKDSSKYFSQVLFQDLAKYEIKHALICTMCSANVEDANADRWGVLKQLPFIDACLCIEIEWIVYPTKEINAHFSVDIAKGKDSSFKADVCWKSAHIS